MSDLSSFDLYRQWLRHIVEVHKNRSWNSPSADQEVLSERWEELTEDQRLRLWGLSQDLESLHGSEIETQEDDVVLTEDEFKSLLASTREANDWDNMLELLRKWPRWLPQSETNLMRAEAWAALDEPWIAALFRDNAKADDANAPGDDLKPKSIPPTKFVKDEGVLYRSTNEFGRIILDPIRESGEYWYKVQFARRTVMIPEDDLDKLAAVEETLQSLACEGKWGHLDAVRCALAVERIEHTNRSTVYAFQSQRILFQPYQYKPLLKVLDSPDRRLLIADEVGLGKTIEAGLILTELNARAPLDSVLIVCPSKLREKWKNELNGKFDEDFVIYDRREFESTARHYIERPGRTKIRGILSIQAMRNKGIRELLTQELGNIDLIVFDEAHHARNANTETYGLLTELCSIADSVVLLTATPVQLDFIDLFNLLHALRPTEFRDGYSFETSLRRHSQLHDASALARTQNPSVVPEIRSILQDTFWRGRSEEYRDPLATQLIDELETSPPQSRSDWVRMERRIQDLHPLGTILTRTKKRDVLENAPKRIASCYRCDWTAEEDEAYQRLVEGSGHYGWPTSGLSFAQVQRARQAASCLPAAYQSIVLGKTDDEAVELSDILPSDVNGNANGYKSQPEISWGWDGTDSKYSKLRDEILDSIFENDKDSKVLIFAFFKGTVRYLADRLNSDGIAAFHIDGDVRSDPRNPDRDERGKRIREFKENPAIRVLVSSEVGSEGLDFQFCNQLVNYDLPWNPMAVEQRIGRIDRFGQKKDKVFIHNLVVAGTVEDRILEKLYERIGIFEKSIGALEAILGETISELKRDYLSGELTPDEAEERVDQAVNAIARREQQIEELERNAAQLFGHEEYVREELQRVRNLGQFVSDKSLLAILQTYLRTKHPTVRIKTEGIGIYAIKPTDELRLDIRSAARRLRTEWYDRSIGGILTFTTSGEIAFDNPRYELINSQHPLVRAAITGISEQMSQPVARLGAAVLRVEGNDVNQFPPGDYFLKLVPVQVHGVRERRVIEVVATFSRSGEIIPGENAQRLLFLTTEKGNDWGAAQAPSLPPVVWEKMEREVLRRAVDLNRVEKSENAALYVRRRNARIAEHEHDLAIRNRRLTTSRINGKAKAVQLFEAQIERARARHEDALRSLESKQVANVEAGEPIAACVVRVTH